VINLLPPDRAMHIKYGRGNADIRRWLAIVLLATVGLALIISGGWVFMEQQSKNLQRNTDNLNQQLKTQNLSQIQKDATKISGDIKVINQVLSQEVRFSDLMREIGTIMPPGAVLGSLTLSKVSGAIDLSANAKDYASATQVAINLNDPKNGLFDKVDIININCSPNNTIYPCNANFKALFSKSAQTKFLSVAKGGN
jgi:Tfp pilus assembly protein PilN